MGKRIGLVFGTRPEAIKMAPVHQALVEKGFEVVVIATAQHRQMLDQVLDLFRLKADVDLDVMAPRQSLGMLTARLAERLDGLLSKMPLDAILVQGDTTSCMVGALLGFYHHIPVGHVEAGLRSEHPTDPFPEEINRRLASQMANLHFAPTQGAVDNLIREGVDPDAIFLTGNTVIDALKWVLREYPDQLAQKRANLGLEGTPYILMTMHRRENWGMPMQQVIRAVERLLDMHRQMHLVFPVHLNPVVREVVFPSLESHPRVILTDPAGYFDFVAMMQGAYMIISDSGGIQEEAPLLGKPVLVLRACTERPEAIAAGTAMLVGTDEETVYRKAHEMIVDRDLYDRMSHARNPFGDGHAAQKIAHVLKDCL